VTAIATAALLVALMLAELMIAISDGEVCMCPMCGSTRDDKHADQCPWKGGGS
jgi:hypothetical protein